MIESGLPAAGLDEMTRFAQLLWEPGDVRELRVPKHNRYGNTASGYFDSPEALAKAAAKWDGRANVYLTLNPVATALLARASNRVLERADHTTADGDVLRRRWLLIDVDPKRPAGISSTDVERDAAQYLLDELTIYLSEDGWPEPVIAMSGNGYYAIYAVDLPTGPESLALVGGVLSALAGRFNTDAAAIDTSVSNASRIIGLIGTLKVKGDSTADRPHRRSEIVEVPHEIGLVTRDQLAAIAPTKDEPTEKPKAPTRRTWSELPTIPDLLDHAGIAYRTEQPDTKGIKWWSIEECPFHPGEDTFKCGLGQAPDGRYAAHCYHNRGAGMGWQDFKKALGLDRFLSTGGAAVWGSSHDGAIVSRAEPNGGSRPQILVNQFLREMAEQGWQALLARNDPPELFVHGSEVAAIEIGEGTPSIVHLSLAGLRGRLDRAADWLRPTNQEDPVELKPAKPPKDVVEDMMALDKPLPPIRGIVGAPIFTTEGVLAGETGYQEETRLYYQPIGEQIASVPAMPDETDLKNAKIIIGQEWLADFPFADDASRAHAIAMPLTVFAREMIDGPTPLFAYDAPSAGTGKGLLAGTAALIATGYSAAMMTETRDEEEMRKRITSILCAGPSVVILDNVKRKLDSATLSDS